eukprot:symbB.v1.2.036036.t1/scaffold4996.1/size31978/1
MAVASRDELRVLVVGAGFGTNAGLGLEVPLQHGKLLTDGFGDVVAVTAEVRRQRALDPGFLGFMGNEFWYLWERPDGYLGNAGFIYGALLKDPRLQVDMLQHPVTEADKNVVCEAASHTREVVNAALSAEATSLRLSGGSQSYAASLAKLVNDGRDDFPELLGESLEEYYRLRENMNLGDKLGLSQELRMVFGDSLIPPAAESDLLRLYLLNKYGGAWVDSTNLCRRPLDDWLPSAARQGFFAFFPDLQSPEHQGVPHIISSFIVASPGHPIASAWLARIKAHWSKSYAERPDLEYLWVNKLFRQLVGTEAEGGDLQARAIWDKVPKISCEHGKKGPMRFYSGPEALSRGDRLFELMLAPATSELIEEVESDRETPMWKLAFREQLEDDSAYWHLLKRTLAQAEETLSHRTAVSKAKKGVLGNCVVLAASKGIAQMLLAMPSIALPVGLVLLNGAEPPAAMDVGASTLQARGPDFAQLGQQFLAHPQVPRLVLTSHGAEVAAQLRKAAVGLARDSSRWQEHSMQRLALFSSLDHRCVPNRENHSLPWSLTFPFECWHPGFGKPESLVSSDGTSIAASNKSTLPPLVHLLFWAAGGPDHLLSLPQFPGPRRFAQLFVETMDLPGRGMFAPVPTAPGGPVQRNSRAERMGSPDDEIYDILFDAQAWEMQVVLKSVKSGSQTPIDDILVKEGQYATRRIRFFRYYEESVLSEKSRKISIDGDLNDKMQWSQHMIHELLAMNKNLGNFLWTGFMTPATAVPRFGSDLMELVIEVELARLGGAYRGYSRGLLDAEHRLQGQYSLLGDCLDHFLSNRATLLQQQRLDDFKASNSDVQSLKQFQEAEDQYFKSHSVKALEGYVRRELTIDHNIPYSEVQQEIWHCLSELGMSNDLYGSMDNFGHSTNFRFFVDGKAWLSAGCEQQDFDFVEQIVREDVVPLAFLATHLDLDPGSGRYFELPPGICPPNFFSRNGYQVVAYRKFGDAGHQFLATEGVWQHWANQPSPSTSEIWVPGFGPAERRSNIFGHFKELPHGEIGRGGTTGRLYFYDTKLRHRSTPGEIALWAAVQANQLSWWELQLYSITAEDLHLAGGEALNFSFQQEFLKLLLRNLFEQELASSKNL